MASNTDNLDHLDLDLDSLFAGGATKTPEEIEAEEAEKREKEKQEQEKQTKEKEEKEKENGNEGVEDNNEDKEKSKDQKDKDKDQKQKNDNDEDDDEEEEDDLTFIQQLQTTFGYDELAEEEFEDSEEGLVAFTQKASEIMMQRSLKQLFEADPLLQKHFEFKQQGGDSQKFIDIFYPKNDWSKVTLEEEVDEDSGDTSTHEAVLKADLLERNFTEEEATEMIKDLKVAGTVAARAKVSLANLQARQAEKQEQLIEQQKQKVIEGQKKAQESWKEINNTIKGAKELAGLPIKEAEKSSFYEYLSKPVTKEGQTQRQLDLAKLDLNKSLALDFLLFKGFDISKLVQTKAKSQQAASLRDRLKGGKMGSTKEKDNSGKDNKNIKSAGDQVDWSKVHTAK